MESLGKKFTAKNLRAQITDMFQGQQSFCVEKTTNFKRQYIKREVTCNPLIPNVCLPVVDFQEIYESRSS